MNILDRSQAVLQLAQQILSPRTGILKAVHFIPAVAGQIHLRHPIGKVPHYAVLPGCADISAPGGSAAERLQGLTKVLFEGLERYSACFVDYSQLIRSAAVNDHFMVAERFPLFADWQYQLDGWPFSPFTRHSEVFWCKAKSLINGERRYVPACQVYVPYQPVDRQECLGVSTSTGMAAAWSATDALLAGLLEVVERDALMVMWFNRLAMPKLQLPADSPALAMISQSLQQLDAKIHLIDITNDCEIPTVLAVLHCRAFGHALTTVGLAAKTDYDSAAAKAFCEAVSDFERIRVHLAEYGDAYWRPQHDFSDVTDFAWHGMAYICPQMQQQLNFIWQSEQYSWREPLDSIPGGNSSQQLVHCLQRLEPLVSEIVAVELTPRDVASLGVHCCKVLIPELVPVNPDHRYPPFGHRRLFEVPVRLGYLSQPLTPAQMNPFPHPFS
jgi:ribosomal protein S12 methylthiotransferase accessory factor